MKFTSQLTGSTAIAATLFLFMGTPIKLLALGSCLTITEEDEQPDKRPIPPSITLEEFNSFIIKKYLNNKTEDKPIVFISHISDSDDELDDNEEKMPALHAAVKIGDIDSAKNIIEQSYEKQAFVNNLDSNQSTPLEQALLSASKNPSHNRLNMIIMLLSYGANLDCCYDPYSTDSIQDAIEVVIPLLKYKKVWLNNQLFNALFIHTTLLNNYLKEHLRNHNRDKDEKMYDQLLKLSQVAKAALHSSSEAFTRSNQYHQRPTEIRGTNETETATNSPNTYTAPEMSRA